MRLAAFSSALAVGLGLAAGALAADGDAANGKKLFDQKCMVCHTADKGGANGVGPALYGVYGHKAGQAPGFSFSPKFQAANLTLTPETLDQWLRDPQMMVPGSKMVIQPITSRMERADLIAFLKSRSDAPAEPDKKSSGRKKK